MLASRSGWSHVDIFKESLMHNRIICLCLLNSVVLTYQEHLTRLQSPITTTRQKCINSISVSCRRKNSMINYVSGNQRGVTLWSNLDHTMKGTWRTNGVLIDYRGIARPKISSVPNFIYTNNDVSHLGEKSAPDLATIEGDGSDFCLTSAFPDKSR